MTGYDAGISLEGAAGESGIPTGGYSVCEHGVPSYRHCDECPAPEQGESRANFLDCVTEELERARDGHPPINSAHEGYSVILEELDEFWDEVKRKRSERDPEAMWSELVQVAAMAARTAEDVLVWNGRRS
jgi:hypothetical protein